MERREFAKLFAGIVSGLGLPVAPPARGDTTPQAQVRESAHLDDRYLALGLTGMARAKGWFDAHWGAALIAGYYLCKENPLAPETVAGIQSQLDSAVALRGEQFAPLPQKAPDEALVGQIVEALAPVVEGGLRAHGHAVIYAALSTKALRDVPGMAQPALIRSLCGLSGQIAKLAVTRPRPDISTAYADNQEMIEALFDNLARFEPLLGRPSVRRPNFTHMTTHTEALLTLDELGHHDLVKSGFAGHAAHISAPLPEFDAALHPRMTEASLAAIMSHAYWDNEEHRAVWNKQWDVTENPNGHWIASGHLFKVLYSYHRLVRRIPDQAKVRLCSQILLERYFNPAVDGG